MRLGRVRIDGRQGGREGGQGTGYREVCVLLLRLRFLLYLRFSSGYDRGGVS